MACLDGLLRAYGIFKRQDGNDGIRRMQLVDYQTLVPDEDLLPGLLQLAPAPPLHAEELLRTLEAGQLRVPKRSQRRGILRSLLPSQV